MTGTTLGVVGVPGVVQVDAAGTLRLVDGTTLSWWVGAEDRWHLVAEEVAVRQRVDGAGTETRVRVPGGDVVARVWAVPHRGRAVAVLEVTNETPVPVAIAMVASGPLRWRAERAPADPSLAPLPRGLGKDETASVWPVPHATSLRLVVDLVGDLEVLPDPRAVPGGADVARGWERHLAAGVRVDLPDGELMTAIASARRALLVAALGWSDAMALYAWGHAEAGDDAVAAGLDGSLLDLDADALVALERFVTRADDGDAHDGDALARALVEPVAAAVHGLAGQAPTIPRRAGMLAAASILDRAGDSRGAKDTRNAAGPPLPVDHTLLDHTLLDHTLLALAPAALLNAVRAALVDDSGVGASGVVDLLAGIPDTWFGQGIEFHDLPTAAGRVSVAVRWHGERPALLWDVAATCNADADPELTLRCTRLDPTWSATVVPRGEALLAAAAVAVVAGPEAATVQRGIAIEPDDPGSFG